MTTTPDPTTARLDALFTPDELASSTDAELAVMVARRLLGVELEPPKPGEWVAPFPDAGSAMKLDDPDPAAAPAGPEPELRTAGWSGDTTDRRTIVASDGPDDPIAAKVAPHVVNPAGTVFELDDDGIPTAPEPSPEYSDDGSNMELTPEQLGEAVLALHATLDELSHQAADLANRKAELDRDAAAFAEHVNAVHSTIKQLCMPEDLIGRLITAGYVLRQS